MNANFQWKQPRVRAGHTLLELLLVLAILAMGLALAIPTYESLVSERRLQKSAEELELQLQEARVKAMRTGQSQVFRFEIGANTYVCEPWMSGKEELNAGPGAVLQDGSGQAVETSTSNINTIVDTSKTQRQLEEGIVFASANTANDSRAQLAVLQENGGTAGATSSTPVMFYPDGTATTAELILEDPKGNRRAIQIRGLTGRTKLTAIASP